jgi:hypothetical protein
VNKTCASRYVPVARRRQAASSRQSGSELAGLRKNGLGEKIEFRMAPLGKTLMFLGGLLLVAGLLLTWGHRLPFRAGRLPGDFVWRGKGATIYFPLGTCLVLSILFSLLSLLFRRR